MYHLTNRSTVACALLLAVLSAPAGATVLGGAIADPPPTRHTAPDVVIDLLTSFTYFPGPGPSAPYTFTANQVGGPTVVDLTVASDRLYVNPREGTAGVALIEVTADDADAGSFTVQFKIEITNATPTLAGIGNQTTDEGVAVAFVAGVTEPDGPADTLTFGLDTAPPGATINPSTGAFSWTPTEADGPGSYAVTISVKDLFGASDTEGFNIDVNEVNQPPVLAAIPPQSVAEGSPLTFNAVATDADLPANTLTYSLSGTVPAGASINPTTGAFSWTPTEAQGPAVVNFDVQVNDGQGGTDAQTVTVTVTEVNEAPVLALIGDKVVDELTALTFTATGSDPTDIPANGLTYSLGGGAPAGAAIDPSTGAFSWTPTESQGPGSYPITVTVTDDGTPALNASETITVTVNEVNEPPVLNPVGDRTIGEGTILQFQVTATDPDLPPNGLNFSLAAGAPSGASMAPGTGVFSWTPTEAQGPGSYPVTIQVTDVDGLTDSETITITVNEVNEVPVLAFIAAQSVAEGSLLTFTASATDVDIPANPLTYSLVGTVPTGATIDATSGLFSWTPDESQGPAVLNIDVQVDDGQGGTVVQPVAVTVSEVNQAPVLTPIGDQTVDEGVALAFVASASDVDLPANTLTYSLDGGAPTGASIDPVTGAFSWTPAEDQQGTHTVTVRVTDNGTPSLDAFETITITVNEVNVAPVLAPIGDQSVDEETLLSFTATATDADIPGNTLTYSLSGSVPAGASIDPVSGLFSWTPVEADSPGTFSITVVVTDDGTPVLNDSETITLTVVEINDPPVLTGDVPDQTMNEDDSTLNVEVRSHFDDPDLGDTPPDTLTVVVLPGYDASLLSIVPNGSGVDVTPLADRYGTTTVTVGVQDAAGVQATDTFQVDVASVNDPVVVASGIADQVAPEDVGSVSVSLAGAFSDADLANGGDTHTVTFSSPNPSVLVAANSPLADLSGTMQFNVKPNANGAVTITVTAEDAAGTQATTTFTLTISPVTDPPFVSNPISDQTIDEDSGSLNVSLAGVFDDPDLAGGGDVQNYSVSHDNGTLISSAGVSGSNLTLDFGPNQNGTANVTVTVTDITGSTASDTFVVTVNPVNDAPVAAPPIPDINTSEDDPTTFTVDVAAYFQDVDIATNADVLTFFLDSNSNPGLFDVATFSGSTITLHLAPDQFGVANLVVRARDAAGASATDTFAVNVASVNDLPVAADDAPTPINEDSGPITIAVLANDYLAETPTTIISAGDGGESQGVRPTVLDPFGDPQQLPPGTVTIVGNQIQYEPAPNFYGTDYFTYEIQDSDGDRATGTVTINVLATNDAPVGIQERTFNMFENGTLIVDAANGTLVGGYDVDGALLDGSGNPVGSPLLAVLTVPPPVGSLNFDGATGAFQFVPPINFTGEVSFLYRLFDGDSLSEDTDYAVRVIVNPTPPPPVLPNPGQVAVTYNISNVPLEQSSSVPPNVLVVMDDSGSMDWNMVVTGADENGGFVLDNSTRTKGKKSDMTSFVYLWDLPTNAYPASSQYGLVVPTDEALAAADAAPGGPDVFIDQEYGLWRARNHLYNTLYYNPEIYYRPWIGQDANNVEFTNAIPEQVRLDPVDPTNVYDITAPHTYTSSQVPEWDNNGGTTSVDVTVYIPRYWTTTSPPPLAWNDPNRQLVEIVNDGRTFVGGPGREDCADDMACTYDEEIQNFANWFQYYRNREYVTKGSIGGVISQLQDIRVGYETISATTSEPVRDMNDLYTEGNKKLLLDNVYAVDSFGGTPLRQALGRAGRIFACQTGSYCPALPAPDGQCQNNFALLFTDGYWNGGAGVPSNDDGDGSSIFDTVRYRDGVRATLADTAMYYYEHDLQPGLADEVPISQRDLVGAPDGTFADGDTMHQHMKTFAIAFGVSGTIPPEAVPTDPISLVPPPPYDLDPQFNPFQWTDPFDGPKEKIDDLLHAATNGRGDFLNASNPQELQAAFESVFLEFTQAASSSSAAAFNSTSLNTGTLLYRGFYDLRDNTGELTATFVNPDGTLGALNWRAADKLNPPTTDPLNRVLVTSHSDTHDGIPFVHGSLSPDQQIMLSELEVDYLRGERDGEGVNLRERPAVDGLLGDIVNSSPIFVGPPLAINRDQAPFPEDDLYSSFAQARAGRNPVVYVGANDGILHGFNAEVGAGEEVFGYIPNKLIDTTANYHNDLEDFASPFYQHKYYVDLTPSVNDVYARPSRAATGKEWMTMLIGGLGGGGKGYFALNVTDPGTQFATDVSAAASVLWEFTDEDDTIPLDGSGNPLTWLDPAGQPVKDLGYAHSQPTMVMSNVSDGGAPARKEWVAVFGNGLNSTAGIAKLFVLFVDRGTDGWDPGDFVKVNTGVGVPISPAALTGYPNGLGEVTAVDVDLNGTVDWVYGGDRLGNLYRFDLTDPDPANWTSTRLFTASYTDGGGNVTVQPIMSKPLISKHPTEDGFLITFGTGSYVAREDGRSQDIQSIYTIWDRGEANPATAQPGSKALRLVEQVITNVVDDSVSPFVTRRIVTENPVNYVSEGATPGVYGWYIDLDMPRATSTISGGVNPDTSGQAPPAAQFPGEKAIRRMILRDGNIIATTVLPSGSGTSCFGTRPGSILLLNALTGGNPNVPIVDFNNDGYVDDGDLVEIGGDFFAGGILFDQDALDGSLVDPSILGGQNDTDWLFLSGGNETVSFRIRDVNDNRTGRLSWQELN